MWFGDKDAKRKKRHSELSAQWTELTKLGRHEQAATAMSEAVDIARQLASEEPDPKRRAVLAAGLYNLAGSLVKLGRHEEALAGCGESEQLYRGLEDALGPWEPVRIWIADALTRKGFINHDWGRGASAVMDLDEAVATCRSAPHAHHAATHFTDLARILAINAKVLADYGDPDLAVTSADWAFRLFGNARANGKMTPAHVEYWGLAAGVAAEIHAACQRTEIAAAAARHAVELERWRRKAGLGDEKALAGALARCAFVLGRDALADSLMREACALSPQAASQAEHAMRAGKDRYVSLAAALAAAVQEFGERLMLPPAVVTRSPLVVGELADAWLTPSDRRPPPIEVDEPTVRVQDDGRQSPMVSGRIEAALCANFADVGVELMPKRGAEGLRMALEAHYGFASGSRRQTMAMRYGLLEVGSSWGRALLACSRAYEQAGALQMALDLAAWGSGLARSLLMIPIFTDRQLARDLVEQHGRLSILAGDRKGGDDALRFAQSLPVGQATAGTPPNESGSPRLRPTAETDAAPTSAGAPSDSRPPEPAFAATSPAAATPASTTTGVPDDGIESRAVRVFVSSTFRDMQGERDALATVTFPALQRRFRAWGVELLGVDLRWGVTEADVTLDVCLSEVKRCKPWFIGLLGQCYGTVMEGEATPELQEAFPVVREGIGRSLTELEIRQGVLEDTDAAKNALFFLRDRAWLDSLASDQRAEFEESTAEGRAKLADLAARIRGVARVWNYPSPEALGPAVETALGALLEARFPKAEAPDAFTETHRLHAAYARDRLLGPYVGGEPYIERLDRWMAEPGAPPMLITGASGGGKSALVAHWLQARRKTHPSEILFAHYLGASPDSADPMFLMMRLWEHLNRATGETVDLPTGNVELMDLAAGLAQRLEQAALHTERGSASIVIALDGLDKLSSEANLRWLPSGLRGNVRLLASSLDGEAKDAALARGWRTLPITLLDDTGRRELIADTLALWGKRPLPPRREARILGHPLAGLPLFLKTVLNELRVGATEAVLDARLDDYLAALDMPALFARVLVRLERDYGRDLVAHALSLVWAARAGLEEGEIIAITGATPFAWAKLRNGLDDNLRDQAGRIAFSHDFLRSAVAARYLSTDEARRDAHLALADRFDVREPDARQAEELPYQLRAVEGWGRLEKLLLDLDRFELLRARGDEELLSYWRRLEERGRDAEGLLCSAFDSRAGEPEQWTEEDIDLAFSLARHLNFAGAAGEPLRRLGERRTLACERMLGPGHPYTLASMNLLAMTHFARGEFESAQHLQERIRDAATSRLGFERPETLGSVHELALTHHARGDLDSAQKLLENVLRTRTRLFGSEDPDTLIAMMNLGLTLRARGDLAGAQKLLERVLEATTRQLGPEHRSTLAAMSNLALTFHDRGDFGGAQKLLERALEAATRRFGPEHPLTVASMSNLVLTLSARGDLDRAQKLQEAALEATMRRLGSQHPDTVASMNHLVTILRARGDLEGEQKLRERVTEAMADKLGPEHPETLTSMSNLAAILLARGDLAGAQELEGRVREARTRVLGRENPLNVTAPHALAATAASGTRQSRAELYEQARELSRQPGGLPDAERLLRTVIDGCRTAIGAAASPRRSDRELLARALWRRSMLLHLMGSPEEGLTPALEAISLFEQVHDAACSEHADPRSLPRDQALSELITAMVDAGEVAFAAGRPDVRLDLTQRALALGLRAAGPPLEAGLETRRAMATAYHNRSIALGAGAKEAETAALRATEIRQRMADPSNPVTLWELANSYAQLAWCLIAAKHLDRAETVLGRARLLTDVLGPSASKIEAKLQAAAEALQRARTRR